MAVRFSPIMNTAQKGTVRAHSKAVPVSRMSVSNRGCIRHFLLTSTKDVDMKVLGRPYVLCITDSP